MSAAVLWALARRVPWYMWALAGVLTLAAVYHWRATNAAYEAGKDAATQTIIDANQKAKDKADAAIKTVDDCFNAGGTWNRARGVCVRSGE